MASRGTARGLAARVALLLLAAAWALFGSAAAADVLILEAAQDNTLFEDAQGDTSSGSGPSLFAGRNSQGLVRRALVSFDVRSALPHDARVDSVTLHLHLSSSSDPSPRAIRVHRVLADWGEGASSSAGGRARPSVRVTRSRRSAGVPRSGEAPAMASNSVREKKCVWKSARKAMARG